jgi:rubredoxin
VLRSANLKKPKKFNRRIAMKKYRCNVCGYVYDPETGDPSRNIPPGTPFEKLPDDWTCPVCGASKEDFSPED